MMGGGGGYGRVVMEGVVMEGVLMGGSWFFLVEISAWEG